MSEPEKNYYPIDISVPPNTTEPAVNTPPTVLSESNIIPAPNGTIMNGGTMQSPNFSHGNSGWKIDSNGNVEFGSGYFRGDITGASGTFSGTLTAATGVIGGFNIGSDYIRDAANSMGMASTVTGGDDMRFWAGDTFANRATAPFHLSESGSLFTKKLSVNNYVDCLDGSVTYSGSWSTVANTMRLHGVDKTSLTVGDYFEITFFGTDIGLVLDTGGDQGKVDIYIDTVFDSTVDLYNGLNNRIPWYIKNGLSNTLHVLRGVVATKNGGSLGNNVIFEGYSLSPNPGILLESLSMYMWVGGWNLTTNANGYAALAVGYVDGGRYSTIANVGFALTSTIMADATLTDPKIGSFVGTVYLYNGAPNTTYTIYVTSLISAY